MGVWDRGGGEKGGREYHARTTEWEDGVAAMAKLDEFFGRRFWVGRCLRREGKRSGEAEVGVVRIETYKDDDAFIVVNSQMPSLVFRGVQMLSGPKLMRPRVTY